MWLMTQSGSLAKLCITELPRPRTPMQATLILSLAADALPLRTVANPKPRAADCCRKLRRVLSDM